jgi:hypothetical protein
MYNGIHKNFLFGTKISVLQRLYDVALQLRFYSTVKKQSRYRPRVAQRVPGS